MFIYMCRFTQPFHHEEDVTQGHSLKRVLLFEFKVFLLHDWLLDQSQRVLSAQLFDHCYRKIHAFSKTINL